jgi:hypothetical protein
LKVCWQKQGESLWNYIRRFSWKYHKLAKICDADIISAFWSSTSCRTLVNELDRDQPKTTKELLDIATKNASCEEAVGAVFVQGDGKAAPSGNRGAPLKAAGKGAKRSAKGNKRGPKRWPQCIAVVTSCDRGDNDKEADNSDEELVAAAERNFKLQAWQPVDHFEKLLEATYPTHAYPTWHKLKECTMMKNYKTTGAFAKGKNPEGDSTGKAAAPSPKKRRSCRSTAPLPHESRHKIKLTSWAVNAASPATLEYLRWFESPITFDRTDHWIVFPRLDGFPSVTSHP